MADLFQSNQVDTYSFVSGGAIVTWSANGVTSMCPLMMQQLQLQYTRQIQPLYPLNVSEAGTSTRYNIMSHAQGLLNCQGLLAPFGNSLESFLQATSKDCATENDAVTLTIKPFTTCETNNNLLSTGFTVKGLILATFGVTITGGDSSIIQLPLQFQFTSLSVG